MPTAARMPENAPATPVAATGRAFETNTLTYTAKTKGAAGNNIVVKLIDPEKDAEDEVVSVSGSTINVTLASADSAITSNLNAVKAAIEGNTAAKGTHYCSRWRDWHNARKRRRDHA